MRGQGAGLVPPRPRRRGHHVHEHGHLGEPNATATQYFHVDDALALWASVREHCGAEWCPEDMPYGVTEFAVRDPNGYLLSFGSPVETGPSGP
jgi:uncharacterized glyoxalase superfamily protein PhnB